MKKKITKKKMALIVVVLLFVYVIGFVITSFVRRDPRAHWSEDSYYYMTNDSIYSLDMPLVLTRDNIDSLKVPYGHKSVFLRTERVNDEGDLIFIYPASMERHKYVCLAWLPNLGGGRYPKSWSDERLCCIYPRWRIRYLQVPRRYQIAYRLLYGGSITESIVMIANP